VILRFDQECPIERVGCKGRNLSLMWQAGLPVPQGFCVTWDSIESAGYSELDDVVAELQAASLAVRSSAVQEDTPGASFAGMLLSKLNVIGTPGVVAALREIRVSAARIIASKYAARLNVARQVRIAAVVQEFVTAEASGVLFMRDPQTAAARLVVEACWGLGPGVVEGLVRPDRWILSPDGEVISSHIADKDVAVVARHPGGTTQTAVDAACRRRPSLSLESLRQLSRLARECEHLFGSPQDIEWAMCDDQVWLVQSRPITAKR
jgi:pyruvate, water dikinase